VQTLIVGRLAPAVSQWDCNMVWRLLDGSLYPHGLNIRLCEGYPHTTGCVLIIPGRYWVGQYMKISEALTRYDWVLAFRTSDEEDLFDIQRVWHPNIRWWVQLPRTDRDYGDARLFGSGFPAHFNKLPAQPVKDLDLFLSAQCTTPRRKQAFEAFRQVHQPNMLVDETPGFTLGMPPAEYVKCMSRAKIAAAPSGWFSPDSFRLYEALEAGAVPIADDHSCRWDYDSRGYWRRLFPDAPFPIIADYTNLQAVVDDVLTGWTGIAGEVSSWWAAQKQVYARWLREDLEAVGAL
jgi:hypothetical protein